MRAWAQCKSGPSLDIPAIDDSDAASQKLKMGDVPPLLATYPRLRPPLPQGWQAIYTEIYKCSREGKTFLYRLAQSLESWMHREVLCGTNTPRLLEIGAGTLNHVQYEPAVGRYDAIEPFLELYSNRP